MHWLLVRYTARILKRTKEEPFSMDRKLTMHGGFHPKSGVDRLYVDRSHGVRDLKSVYDVVRNEEGQIGEFM